MRDIEYKEKLGTGAAEIEDGRLTMNAAGKMTLIVTTPRCKPLSKTEPTCRIEARGEGVEAKFDLTTQHLDGLIDSLEAIRDGEVWKDD